MEDVRNAMYQLHQVGESPSLQNKAHTKRTQYLQNQLSAAGAEQQSMRYHTNDKEHLRNEAIEKTSVPETSKTDLEREMKRYVDELNTREQTYV